jgi:hypothetical protein
MDSQHFVISIRFESCQLVAVRRPVPCQELTQTGTLLNIRVH